MRESKILKFICYLIIPILVLNIILSVFYQFGRESFENKEKYDKTYFQSDNFLSSYMKRLVIETDNLIFNNSNYSSIKDGDFTICYKDTEIYLGNAYSTLEDFYYLILYKDIALTNVELTVETNTINKIKSFISNCDGEKANIIYGNVESSSEIISNKALQYFSEFENTYYSLEGTSEVIDNQEVEVYNEESEVIEIIEEEPSQTKVRKYYNTQITDFEIYTTYKESVIQQINDMFYKTLIDNLKYFETQMIVALPISSVLLVCILIYLIIAIGHTKGKQEIDLNDFDKIPIEIIIIVASILVCIVIALSLSVLNYVTEEYYAFSISMLLAAYLISYILCAITCVTIIKRVKAKTLIKDSITGKIFRWCLRLWRKLVGFIKQIINNIKNSYRKMLESWPIISKISISIIGYFIIAIILISIMGGFGFIIDLALAGYILYKFFEKINCYQKIEQHLKNMYEGDHTKKLESSEFTPEFQEIIKYINDVSSGFENAIQEGIKSERMKTELITNVSHDIKTPLTSIINYVDLLKEENIENEKAKEYINILDSKSQRLKKLTEDLVEASKASSGNVKLNIEKINICELIKQTTGEFEDKFKNKNLEIISNIPEKEIFINADNRYMYRVIENLFSNISKYALNDSRVYIDVIKNASKVKAVIKNISQERLNISSDELIQRFVRGDKSRTTEGSGLGISISKSLTELQNGIFDLSIDGDLFKIELEFEVI